ncbi:uncharacterized protein LOC125579759 [Brassica napus]|uniref:uncharacterized protein LOC125579759 n=1 Tax=Brassica napus TaxID=3708 RepID=UPI0020786935|nr:uncharacterized protein LOC125579759 [Brassica napus]
MDSNSYIPVSNFVDLLNSQQETVFGFVQDSGEVSSSQVPLFSSQVTEAETPGERKERRSWTPVDDVALISAWLNTSKDPVVGNEQRAGAFWKGLLHTLRLVPRLQELRNDQKWCELPAAKTAGSSKKRKCDESAQSSSSYVFETTTGEEEQTTIRPPGVKASKGFGKKTMVEGKRLTEFHSLWSIRKEDIAAKERLTKMKLFESLVAKQELADYESCKCYGVEAAELDSDSVGSSYGKRNSITLASRAVIYKLRVDYEQFGG